MDSKPGSQIPVVAALIHCATQAQQLVVISSEFTIIYIYFEIGLPHYLPLHEAMSALLYDEIFVITA